MDFHPVEANLRESFRVLAFARARGDVLELPGVTIASAGVAFHMFNAGFLSAPVAAAPELEERLATMEAHFAARRIGWAFWCCEDWLPRGVRRKLGSICSQAGLHLSSEMPGMAASAIQRTRRAAPLELRRAISGRTLTDFQQIGAVCFHVPPLWYQEVFDHNMGERPGFQAWVGYLDGVPVATAATVVAGGAIGIYNVATAPEFRRRGYGSAITRMAAQKAMAETGVEKLILQASAEGVRMYEAMGFRAVTRIVVYNSMP